MVSPPPPPAPTLAQDIAAACDLGPRQQRFPQATLQHCEFHLRRNLTCIGHADVRYCLTVSARLAGNELVKLWFGQCARCRQARSVSDTATRMLFVVATRISTNRDAAMLAATVSSIRCHHPGSLVVVVDNGSPVASIPPALAHTYDSSSTIVVALRQSMGQLGSWALARSMLREWNTSSLPPPFRGRRIDTVVFLQHTTALINPVPAHGAHCAASCLTGAGRGVVSQIGGSDRTFDKYDPFLDPSREPMRWVCNQLDHSDTCVPPCGDAGDGCRARISQGHWMALRGSGSNATRSWKVCDHSAVSFSRMAWEELSSASLWPGWRNESSLASSTVISNTGMEVISGILTRWLSRNMPASTTHSGYCGHWNVVHKLHGRNRWEASQGECYYCSPANMKELAGFYLLRAIDANGLGLHVASRLQRLHP